MRVATLLLLGLLAACTPQIDHHGYLAKPGVFDHVQKGMSKSEVEAVLGSPSTTASVNFQGDSYYYISSVTEQRAFFNPKEVDRQVIAVRFDQSDQVASFGQYGLEDGRIVEVNTRETPSAGREFSILRQIFGNLGTPGLPSTGGAGP
jgi:outer membrane protein assembly factor BamE (lipoprotein component of BamABCDE complex)